MKKIKVFLVLIVLFISISAVSAEGNFTALQNEINDSGDSLEITQDYTYDNSTDYEVNKGVLINKSDFTIEGNGYTIDGANQASIFEIIGDNITILNLNIINGHSDWAGGAVFGNSNLILNNVTFTNNYAMAGGAVFNAKTTEIIDCTFENNTASDRGGSFYCEGTANIVNSKFINSAGNGGTAICSNWEMTITDSTFENLTADVGAALLNFGVAEIENCTFNNNIAEWGGSIYSVSDINIRNSRFSNSKSTYAPAIYAQGNISVSDTVFENLYADQTAGAIGLKVLINGEINNCTFENTTAIKNGGAVYINMGEDTVPTNMYIVNSTFLKSSGDYGGALVQLAGNLTIENSIFAENTAEYEGGAIFTSHTIFNLINTTFDSNNIINHKRFDGGAVYCDMCEFASISSIFTSNTKTAIYAYDSNLSITGNEFKNNKEAVHCVFSQVISAQDNEYNDDILILNDTNYESVVTRYGEKLELINNTINVETLPARFDLRDWGWVSSVKNQGYMGSCWTFGACGALESSLLKATGIEYDFSENNVQDNGLRYSKYGNAEGSEGGYGEWALEYFLSWLGPLPTGMDSYDQLGLLSPIITSDNNIHIHDAIFIEGNGNETDTDAVKKAIMKYGSLDITYYACKAAPYFNVNTSAQYQNESTDQDHSVSLVGWDDNYPKENFLITPPGDGAWIIKNSWDTTWGDKGYAYISYYDSGMFINPSIVYVIENTENYSRNYQTDLCGNVYINDNNGSDVTYTTFYECYANELISAVGTYFNEENEDYLLKIYVNDELKHTQNGLAPFEGYHTVKLTKEIPIKMGDIFRAEITKKSLPIINDSRQHYPEGITFADLGNGWQDLSLKNMTTTLKVYVKELAIYTEDLVKIYKNASQFEANIGVANETVTFEINGGTYNRISDESGIARMTINLSPDNYTIKTTYNNFSVENSIVVLPTLIAENLVKYYRNASQFFISLIDEAGNPVAGKNITMNINGVFYNRLTNENGTAKLNINLNPGDYILTATDPLTDLMMSYNITVLPTLNATNLEMKYKDGSKFMVSVLDGQGKPLANAKVTFNINGVLYTRTSDSQGIAKLNINLMAGKYIITSEYDGLRISNTITIKD